MKNHLKSIEKGVKVKIYIPNRILFPGDEMKIRISSRMKLSRVSWCWNHQEDLIHRDEKVLFHHYSHFTVSMVVIPGNRATLKIITEVERDGSKQPNEHIFCINDVC